MTRQTRPVVIAGFTRLVAHPRAQLARVSPTAVVPSRFSVGVLIDEPRILVDMEIYVAAGGQPQVLELGVRGEGGAPITTTTLRAIPVDYVVRAAMNYAQQSGVVDRSDVAPGAFQVEGDVTDTTETIRVSPTSSSTDRPALAARIYTNAVAQGSKAPTEAVALEMHVSRSQASRYIRTARQAGLLSKSGKQDEGDAS